MTYHNWVSIKWTKSFLKDLLSYYFSKLFHKHNIHRRIQGWSTISERHQCQDITFIINCFSNNLRKHLFFLLCLPFLHQFYFQTQLLQRRKRGVIFSYLRNQAPCLLSLTSSDIILSKPILRFFFNLWICSSGSLTKMVFGLRPFPHFDKTKP